MAKKKLTTAKKRAQLVEKSIRDVWSSLESHLQYTHEKHQDSSRFHKKTVKSYARTIEQLTRLF